MIELFKPVAGFESYKVSNLGRVWSLRRGKALRCTPHKGYPRASLFETSGGVVKSRRVFVHILVAEHFLPEKPSEGHEINHKDHNPANPRWDNLEWVTHKENMQWAKSHDRWPHTKLKVGMYEEFSNDYGSMPLKKLTVKYAVGRRTITEWARRLKLPHKQKWRSHT